MRTFKQVLESEFKIIDDSNNISIITSTDTKNYKK